MRHRRLPALVALLAALPFVSCSGGGGDDHDPYVLTVDGTAEVTAAAVSRRLGSGRHQLSIGQTVRVTNGTAVLYLPDRSWLELRSGRRARGADDAVVRVAPTPTLLDGDALVVARSSLALRSGAAAMQLRQGAARVWRSSGVTIGVYDGRMTVEALGRRLPSPVRRLRQVSVSDTGTLPRRPVPLVFDRRRLDPWDRRYLGGAIDLGEQLDRRSRAITRQLASPSRPDAGYFASIVPALRSAPGFGDRLVDAHRSVGETSVGASIALEGRRRFVRRWTAAFRFRSQGADWGLVALDQRARREPVLRLLDGVLDRVTSSLAAPLGAAPAVAAPRRTLAPTATGRRATPPSSPSTTPATGVSPVTVPPLTVPPNAPVVPETPTVPTEPSPTVPPPPVPPPTVPEPLRDLLGDVLGDVAGGAPPPIPRL